MSKRRSLVWGWVLLGLVLALAGAVRARQVLRADVIGDEMLHLPSFKNHYGEESIFPIFRRRLETPGGAPESVRPVLRKFYDQGPWAQRSLLVLIDGHPPLHPLLLELIQAVTYDGLLVMRLLSLLASLAGVVLAFRLGRELLDFALGLWLAALLAVSLVPVFFGGVARGYALIEPAALWFLLCAMRSSRQGSFIDGRVLTAALLWQLVQWFSWPLVGGAVCSLAVLALRSGTSVAALVRRMSWYVGASACLLVYLYVQSRNPTLRQAGTLSFDPLLAFRLLAELGPASYWELALSGGARWGAAAALLLAGVGVWRGAALVPEVAVRIVCVWVPAAVGLLLILAAPGHVRHLCAVGVPLALLIALGLRALVPTSLAGPLALSWAALGATVELAEPAPHHAMLTDPAPGFVATAPVLKAEVERSKRWVSYPYFVADSYYRALPGISPPAQPQTLDEFARYLEGEAPLTVLMYRDVDLEPQHRARLIPVTKVDGLASIYRLSTAPFSGESVDSLAGKKTR